jgi:hypothetical protein
MVRPHFYSFARYLAAKRTVDDRALNHAVWCAFLQALASQPHVTCLELGGGIGTMVERLWEAHLLPPATYHLVDAETDNIAQAAKRLARLAVGVTASEFPGALPKPPSALALRYERAAPLDVHLHAADAFAFLDAARDLSAVDVVIANAFLDLVDLDATLARLVARLRRGAVVYFTINFDGATILEPAIDPAFDRLVVQVYHRTMDERIVNGKLSGDSHTGRHLFHAMQRAGIQVLAAGSSDWVVIPQAETYPHDEAYFLHFIVNTMAYALADHPLLDTARFAAWIETRHRQIETGELVYIAHQMDYLGRVDTPTA